MAEAYNDGDLDSKLNRSQYSSTKKKTNKQIQSFLANNRIRLEIILQATQTKPTD
jgi:hypothetical protein